MTPGARSKFGASTFETEDFGKQLYCIEESTFDIVGAFLRPPHLFDDPVVIRRPGNCASICPPRYAPARLIRNICKLLSTAQLVHNFLLLKSRCF